MAGGGGTEVGVITKQSSDGNDKAKTLQASMELGVGDDGKDVCEPP